MDDVAIHGVSADAGWLSVRLPHAACHCEEDDRTTRQSIVSRGHGRLISSFTEAQGIATGFALAMTTHSLSLRGENEVIDAAIHRVSIDAVDLSLRLLVLSGSPRAAPSR